MIWETLLMALREIRRNPMRTLLTTLGIVIGVGSVIAMITVGRGATAKVTADIANMGTNLLIVSPGADRHGPTASTAPALTIADAAAIARDVPAAAKVAPTSTQGALVVFGNKNWNSSITGTTSAWFSVRGFSVAGGGKGTLFSEAQAQGGAPVCVIGATVRRELFGAQDPVGASIRVGKTACVVVGALASKGQSSMGPDQDDVVVMPLITFQRRLAGDDDVGTIFVSATRSAATIKAKSQITALLHERRRIAAGQPNNFSVEDMKEMAKTLGSVTTALTALLGAIAGVSLVVGGIGIMNIMLVSVTERTREIGLRMAIGATGGEVLTQFLVEAVALSTLGGTVGVVFGLGSAYGVTRLLHVPFVAATDIVGIAFAFSAAIGIAFGFLPARRASRLNPIVALRHE